MIAREISEVEKSSFLKIAEECDSVFCSNSFSSSFGPELVHFGIFDKTQTLVGGFVALRAKLKGISALIDPTYAPHCGLFLQKKIENGFKRNQQIKKVMEAITTCLNAQKVKIISISFPPEFNDLQIAQWTGFDVKVKYTYRLDLKLSLENIISGYNPKLKSSMQKFFNGELLASPDLSTNELIRMIRSSQKSKNIKKNEAHLEKLAQSFIEKNKHATIAYKLTYGDNISNVTFCIHGSKTCYYLMGALNKETQGKNAGPICIHQSIVEAKLRNLSVFDFEGSSIPAIESFFRSFGGELTPYYRLQKCPSLLKRFLK
ncbi:MAG: hypothetical protein SGI87_12715 [Flavobacteriales bacterium]|nr:hypothetical protein [Flavobacteriales bacterium]